jgi:hypothetical protein
MLRYKKGTISLLTLLLSTTQVELRELDFMGGRNLQDRSSIEILPTKGEISSPDQLLKKN